MWNKPYTLKEGFAIAVGLLLTGLALQMMVGPLDWDIFAWPGNIAVLFGLIVVLIVIYLMRKRFYFCSFLTTMQAAVPAMLLAVVLTIVMGLTRQVPSDKNPADPIGITKMLSFWPFVLEYVWMTVIVGEVTIHQLVEFKRRRIPSFVSHLGLFIVLTCSTLGSADMKRLKMFCEIGKPEWRGLDAWNNVHELDIALQLERFTIDEYPPKLMMLDRRGTSQPAKKPDMIIADTDSGRLGGWTIRIKKYIPDAMPVALSKMIGRMPAGMMANIRMDSLGMSRNKAGYIPSKTRGAAYAAFIEATHGKEKRSGWVTCGSFLFPLQMLHLDNNYNIAMSNPEPRRYASLVDVYTKDGKAEQTEIEVNKPFAINGWKIYQLSFNEQMGKWSEYSVFELVADPWQSVVYSGIFLLLAGAIGMFLTASTSKRKEPQQ